MKKKRPYACDYDHLIEPLDALRIRKLDSSNALAVEMEIESLTGRAYPWGYGIFEGRQLIGVFDIVPSVAWWMKEGANKWQSLSAFSVMENLMAVQGHKAYLVHCHTDSPYYSLMERMFDRSPMGPEGSPAEVFCRKLD